MFEVRGKIFGRGRTLFLGEEQMTFNFQNITRRAAIPVTVLLSIFLLTGCSTEAVETCYEDAIIFSGETDEWQAKLIQCSRSFIEDKEVIGDGAPQFLWVKYKGTNLEDVKNEVELKIKQGGGGFGLTDEINEFGYLHAGSTNHLSEHGDVLTLNLKWNDQQQTIDLTAAPIKDTGLSPIVLVGRYLQALKDGDLKQVYECTNYLQLPWDYWKERPKNKNITSKFDYIEKYYIGGVSRSYTNKNGNTACCQVPVHFLGKDGRTFEAVASLSKFNGQWLIEDFTATDCSVPNSLRVVFHQKTPFPMVINCSPGAVRFFEIDLWGDAYENYGIQGHSLEAGPPEIIGKIFFHPADKKTYSIAERREALKDIEITAKWSADGKDFGPVLFTYDDIAYIREFYAEPFYGW